MSEEKTKQRVKKPETTYKVHNMVRRVETRMHRVKSSTRHRLTLLIGGGLLRIPRGRSIPVTESLLKKLAREIEVLEKQGKAMVTTMTGQRVSLATFKVVEAVPAPAPKPAPPQDSVARDKTFEHGVGEHKPTFPGGKAITENVSRPSILDNEVPDGRDEVVQVESVIPPSLLEELVEPALEPSPETEASPLPTPGSLETEPPPVEEEETIDGSGVEVTVSEEHSGRKNKRGRRGR